MSKTTVIRQLALETGLPEDIRVTYHRAGKRWYVQYPVPLGADAVLGHDTTLVAHYASVPEAREQLPEDVARFYTQYGRILAVINGEVERLSRKEAKLLLQANRSEGLTLPFDPDYRQLIEEGAIETVAQLATSDVKYRLTQLGQQLVAAHQTALTHWVEIGESSSDPDNITVQYNNVTKITQQEALYQLLDRVEQGQPVPTELIGQARAYVARLEQGQPVKQHATGRYTSRHPEAEAVPLAWEQPGYRQAPIYTHAIVCGVCGEAVTIRNHSPNPPSVCERENCQVAHQRALARARKRRQRSREKQVTE